MVPATPRNPNCLLLFGKHTLPGELCGEWRAAGWRLIENCGSFIFSFNNDNGQLPDCTLGPHQLALSPIPPDKRYTSRETQQTILSLI